jgi:hypothetical protein
MRQWQVKGKAFVWDRPLRGTDLKALGELAPDGPILAACVEDIGAKEALLADDPGIYFTTPHFDRYAIVLARLEEIGVDDLRELVVEAWLTRAPQRLAKDYAERELGGSA